MAAPEHIFRIDPVGTSSATILIVPPLFEEANRTRRTLVLAMRALAAEGFAALLPDLPGQNESQGSEESRVGNECVSTCRSWWTPYHYKKNKLTKHQHKQQ